MLSDSRLEMLKAKWKSKSKYTKMSSQKADVAQSGGKTVIVVHARQVHAALSSVMSSTCSAFQLFVCGVDTLLDVGIRHQQHRHLISAEQHYLLIDSQVKFVQSLNNVTPVQKGPSSFIDLMKHKVLEQLDQISVTCIHKRS